MNSINSIIIQYDRGQAPPTLTFSAYKKSFKGKKLVDKGKEKMDNHNSTKLQKRQLRHTCGRANKALLKGKKKSTPSCSKLQNKLTGVGYGY